MTDMAGFGDGASQVMNDVIVPGSKVQAGYPVAAGPADRSTIRQPAPSGVIDELLVGQVFLVQATIESASALGEGFQAARRALEGDGEMSDVLERTRHGVFEPYRARYQLFRQLPRYRQN